MDLPTPPRAVTAVAEFVWDRLAEVSGTIVPLLRRDVPSVLPVIGPDGSVIVAARQLATVIVGAAAPFAPTSYSRARLVRQMHASGLLAGTDRDADGPTALPAFSLDAGGRGAPS